MNELATLLNSLDLLSPELRKTGKVESENFFAIRRGIVADRGGEIDKRKAAIKELTTCRAMAQHADFSVAEEALLENVVSDATACSASIP
ncbi:hypothetical protein [Paraburkholderia sp.]|uniref:hypothetical protein n=1 Tax=Paraburkholderia sp. TaxID=1926495 RepID=UPI003D6F0541